MQSIGSGASVGGVRLMMAARSAPTDSGIAVAASEESATAAADTATAAGAASLARGFGWINRVLPNIWRARLGESLPADAAMVDDAVVSRRAPAGSKAVAAAVAPSEYDRTAMLDDRALQAVSAASADADSPEVVLCEAGDEAPRSTFGASTDRHVRSLPYLTRAALLEALDTLPVGDGTGWAKLARHVDAADRTARRWRAVARAMDDTKVLGGEAEAPDSASSPTVALLASGTAAERRVAWRRAHLP